MKNDPLNHVALSDADLLLEVHRLVSDERKATARLIVALGELDARRLYLGQGCSSLFTYCTQVLHFSEHAAYLRIEAARAARQWPIVVQLLAEGALHLTAVALLSRQLTAENHDQVLATARHKTKREIEKIVAALRPQPDVPSTVRKLPEPKAPAFGAPAAIVGDEMLARQPAPNVESPKCAPAQPKRAVEIKPIAPERYKVQFTVSRETYDKLREAQDLLRYRLPDGDLASIVDRALTLLLAELHKTKHAAVDRPRTGPRRRAHGRHVSAAVKRAVWQRDGGQCAFVGAHGRCTERSFLEYHHVVPYAERGATTVDNIELRCRAHNSYEAERWFGVEREDLVREARVRYGV